MKSGKITAVVAVRKGSQRVPNKNIGFKITNFT